MSLLKMAPILVANFDRMWSWGAFFFFLALLATNSNCNLQLFRYLTRLDKSVDKTELTC